MTAAFKALRRKRTLFALVLSLTVVGAVYGFAATLNVATQALSAGNATVTSCQQSGSPLGTYTVAYDSASAGYAVTGVSVTGIDAACATKAVSVTLTGASGAGLITVTGVAAGTSLALTPGSTVSAALVSGVSVAINA